ncbi:hypothetical protein [Vibrio phage BUCT006]|nr:hypothetical protein [Vibrio phage BUCT006]
MNIKCCEWDVSTYDESSGHFRTITHKFPKPMTQSEVKQFISNEGSILFISSIEPSFVKDICIPNIEGLGQ